MIEALDFYRAAKSLRDKHGTDAFSVVADLLANIAEGEVEVAATLKGVMAAIADLERRTAS